MQSFRQKQRKISARIFSSENVCCLYKKCYHLTMEIKLKSNHNFHFLRLPKRCDSMRLLGRVAICKKFRFSSSGSTSYTSQSAGRTQRGNVYFAWTHVYNIVCTMHTLYMKYASTTEMLLCFDHKTHHVYHKSHIYKRRHPKGNGPNLHFPCLRVWGWSLTHIAMLYFSVPWMLIALLGN